MVYSDICVVVYSVVVCITERIILRCRLLCAVRLLLSFIVKRNTILMSLMIINKLP